MATPKKKTKSREIDIDNFFHRRNTCFHFGIDQEKLKEAVAAVGNNLDDISGYLKDFRIGYNYRGSKWFTGHK